MLSIGEQMKANNARREWEATDRRRKIDLEEKKEMRKLKQVELNERKLNFDMLQTLLAKTTPLTPYEEAYKEQLIELVYGGGTM